MDFRSLTKGLSLALLVVLFPVQAKLTFEDYKKLSRLPDSVLELDDDSRVAWLKAKIASDPIPVEKYRLQRQLFYEFFWTEQNGLAEGLCTQNQPLREDFYYRENCVEVIHQDFESFVPAMFELIHDARQSNDNSSAAELIANLAWRQSQHGDISGAYQNYAAALALVPSDDIFLLNTIMMDTATNYIIHGDDRYIHKGIALLEEIRERSLAMLEQSNSQTRESLVDSIILTSFNTGIAYTLHLHDYQKALVHFDKVTSQESDYLASALSFSSLAAAKLGQFNNAKAYINRLGDRKDSQPLVETYLSCYRQLAIRHWDNTQSLSSCLNLDSATTIEVQLDIYKRLTKIDDPKVKLHALNELKNIFLEKIEPQLKSRGSQAASYTELRRLQRESELKSVVLKQQKELQNEREEAHSIRQKFFFALFIVLLTLILLVVSQLRQKKKLAKQFQLMSTRDPLTQLGNRRYLEHQIKKELAHIQRGIKRQPKIALGVYIFDIDHFKNINDTYGHEAGDKVLLEISRRTKLVTRDTDILVRWGGEEFVYIARLDENEERIYQLANRILESINGEPFEVGQDEPLKVTCTIGAVKFPFIDSDNIQLWTRLVSLADSALYYGKTKQRNCWVIIKNHNITTSEQLDQLLKAPLQEAIENNMVSIETSY